MLLCLRRPSVASGVSSSAGLRPRPRHQPLPGEISGPHSRRHAAATAAAAGPGGRPRMLAARAPRTQSAARSNSLDIPRGSSSSSSSSSRPAAHHLNRLPPELELGVVSKHKPRHRQMAMASSVTERSVPERMSERPSDPTPKGGNWQNMVLLSALGILICYADRSNISTAILPMAQEYGWDKSYQGFVLSAFFAGYMLTQLLGGRLSDRYGGKMVLATGVAIWSVCTAATPWAAAAGAPFLIASRVCMGLGEGVAFPACHSLIAREVPYTKQSTSVAVVTAASYVGTAVAFGLVPTIIDNLGWQWSFYMFGAAAVLWIPFWLPIHVGLSSSSSNAVLTLSDNSTEALEEAPLLPTVQSESRAKHQDTPEAAEEREVIAICVAQYTQSWGLYGLISWLPSFFSDYYHVEVGDLGGLTMLPYVVQGGMGAVSGVAADALISSGFRVRTVRVGLQVVGMLGPAACLVAATSPLTGGSAETGSLIITVGLGLSALSLGGVSASHLDIAPKNAGTVFGMGNTLATLAGLLAVPVNGLILDATDSWALVFGLIAAHYVVGALLWALWAGGEKLDEDV